MKSSFEMVRRVKAAQKTLDRFVGKPFVWGSVDCSRIVAFHLRQLDHKPGLTKFGAYKTALGARAALNRAGFSSLGDVLDAMGLAAIPPAAALVGDIVQGEGTDAFDALAVYLGNDAMLGFHEDAASATVLRRTTLKRAWTAI